MKGISIKKKVFLIILVVIFSISDIFLIYLSVRYSLLKKDNEEIRKEISKINEDILNINNDFDNSSLELDNKKVELKGKIEEYNIWLEMIKKIK